MNTLKPHLRLHITKKGDWWVSGHDPRDRDYTLCSTLNFLDPLQAAIAARPMTLSLAAYVQRTERWAS